MSGRDSLYFSVGRIELEMLIPRLRFFSKLWNDAPHFGTFMTGATPAKQNPLDCTQ
jgi:hypothetical protein